MPALPLRCERSHLFLELDGALWLLDTGAPSSFGPRPELAVAGQRLQVADSYLGLRAADLSDLLGIGCEGLLGGDVLGRFDLLLDVPGGRATLTTEELELPGRRIPLDQVMGVPLLTARVLGREHRLFFDTGAQISYLQSERLAEFPSAGPFSDFYPGLGRFETATHWAEIELGSLTHRIRCGTLPGLLGFSLLAARADGVIGNEIVRDGAAGYFPRRGLLVLPAAAPPPPAPPRGGPA